MMLICLMRSSLPESCEQFLLDLSRRIAIDRAGASQVSERQHQHVVDAVESAPLQGDDAVALPFDQFFHVGQ